MVFSDLITCFFYFGNYQRISVSIKSVKNAENCTVNAIWVSYTILRPNSYIYWTCSILSMHAVFALRTVFFGVQTKGKLIFRNIDNHMWQIESPIAQKLNIVDFNNSTMLLKYNYAINFSLYCQATVNWKSEQKIAP